MSNAESNLLDIGLRVSGEAKKETSVRANDEPDTFYPLRNRLQTTKQGEGSGDLDQISKTTINFSIQDKSDSMLIVEEVK
jgi:hypothetical protein